ncbi:hypothetical protein WG66_010572 [Moniliophthora roreri]|nr:hypothetical protein WG66_010572 [Moniliophthora roreri]
MDSPGFSASEASRPVCSHSQVETCSQDLFIRSTHPGQDGIGEPFPAGDAEKLEQMSVVYTYDFHSIIDAMQFLLLPQGVSELEPGKKTENTIFPLLTPHPICPMSLRLLPLVRLLRLTELPSGVPGYEEGQ